MENALVYLDDYTLQSDMRIRLPKSAIANTQSVPGETHFSIYYDNASGDIILKPVKQGSDSCEVKNND